MPSLSLGGEPTYCVASSAAEVVWQGQLLQHHLLKIFPAQASLPPRHHVKISQASKHLETNLRGCSETLGLVEWETEMRKERERWSRRPTNNVNDWPTKAVSHSQPTLYMEQMCKHPRAKIGKMEIDIPEDICCHASRGGGLGEMDGRHASTRRLWD
jgi:hypothetical protein